LERMPAPESKQTVLGVVSENKPVGSTSNQEADLLGDDLTSPTAPTANGQASTQRNEDLLAEIFGGGASSSTSSPPPAAQQKSSVNDILGLFGSTTPSASSPAPASSYSSPVVAQAPSAFSLLGDMSMSSPPPQPAAPAPAPAAPKLQSYPAYERNGLTITLTPQTNPAKPGFVNILARFQVTGSEAATSVNFQAAVPKTQQLQMLPMSNSTVSPGATETQQLRVIAPQGAAVRLRLRISFTLGMQPIQDQVDFAGFPPGLTD